jgi:flavin-dependent dehydrogenase
MTTEPLYDVAIIGGGLAGLCLAIQCADAQRDVVLYEKENYPFHKVCGEYISLESWNFLERLGLNLSAFNLPVIKSMKLSDSAGNSHSFKLPLGGFGISRYSLDYALYHIAINKGVKIYTNTKVTGIDLINDDFTITSSNGISKAKIAAGTFGKRSNIDVKWNRPFIKQKPNALNNYIGIKYHIESSHNSNEVALHNFYNGYCGLSQIEDGKSCLCYLTTAENLRVSGNSIKVMEETILFKNPEIKAIYKQSKFLYEEPLAISQVSFNKKEQIENHVIMIGDAAGMISPLCGNGMSMAMHASKIAFEKIALFLTKELSRDGMERAYTADWQTAFSKRLLIGRNVQRMFGGQITTSLFLKAMKTFSPIASAVIKSTHGKPF